MWIANDNSQKMLFLPYSYLLFSTTLSQALSPVVFITNRWHTSPSCWRRGSWGYGTRQLRHFTPGPGWSTTQGSQFCFTSRSSSGGDRMDPPSFPIRSRLPDILAGLLPRREEGVGQMLWHQGSSSVEEDWAWKAAKAEGCLFAPRSPGALVWGWNEAAAGSQLHLLFPRDVRTASTYQESILIQVSQASFK